MAGDPSAAGRDEPRKGRHIDAARQAERLARWGRTFEGRLMGQGLKVAICASRFNGAVTSRLVAGAARALAEHGVHQQDIDVIWVPGAFELPLAARRAAAGRRYDAVVCLGAVVRGETPHFDFVAAEAARGIARVGLEAGKPVTFGVITADTMEQAMDRAGGKVGNRGEEAALAALELATLLRDLPR